MRAPGTISPAPSAHQKLLDPSLYRKNDNIKFEKLAARLRNNFVRAMDNDLDSSAAIRGLDGDLDRLIRFREEQGINKKQSRTIRRVLRDMDSVFMVLGC